VIGVSVAVGVASGLLSRPLGLSPGTLWAVTFPSVFLLLWLLFNARAAAIDEPTAQARHAVLLDASARGRRLVQVIGPMAGTFIGSFGIALLVREGGGGIGAGVAVVVGVALILASLACPISWTVLYKGHQIRFDNYPCIAERLFIDGVLVDRGGFGVVMTLRGRIAGGDGGGEQIVATSRAGLVAFTCRIVAVP